MKLRIFIFFIFSVCFMNASILQTKHNLSTSGTGTIKASSEQEVCAFCHIPHNAQPGKPLWNRAMPSSSYTMYNSTYLERTNYPTPTDLGTATDTPGNLSRQCLSCHDGTIAVGGVFMIRGTVLGDSISVNNTNPNGTMKSSASGFIGTDLSSHHPVGYEYGASMTFNIDVTSRGNELKATPTSPVKLYNYSGKNYVECSSCHDPHTNNGKFLRMGADNNDSHALNVKNTCIACHDKDGWTSSAHDSSNTLYTDSTALSKYGAGTTVSDMGCANCHMPHNGEGQPYLLRKVEQNTCFQGAASSTATASCHQSGGSKDIESVLGRFYGHGFTLLNTDNVHTNLDYIYGANVTRFPSGSKGINWSDSKHVECMDCHNQHQAKQGTHAAAGSWYPADNQGSNLISKSGALTGASGVRPTTWPSRWLRPSNFTTLETATYEYEICFKCHSSWGLGDNGDNNPESGYPTISDPTVDFTDTAWEFNKNNRSGHPVTVSANNRTGSPGTRKLADNQMDAPWKAEGTQTMYCSDCHGTDNEAGSDAKGPHGSSYKFMLKGVNKYWPTNSGGSHYVVGENKNNWSGVFCDNCHNINVDRSGGKGAPHRAREEMDGLYCVNCHVAIPHGSPLSRLQVYDSFPEPYNYEGNRAALKGFSKANSYGDQHAYAANWKAPSGQSMTSNRGCEDRKHDTSNGHESSPY